MVNTRKIKGRLAELGLTQRDVADALELAQPTICQKINNTRPMNLEEAEKLLELLHIKTDQISTYFFC